MAILNRIGRRNRNNVVSITKREAKERGITESQICEFHLYHPDQTAVQDTCQDCQIICDPCGCGEDGSCSECEENDKEEKKP